MLQMNCGSVYLDSTSAYKLSQVRIPKISNVITKLEDYSFEPNTESDLDLVEMVEAYNEYKNLSTEVVGKLRDALPLFHLVSDFLLIPMERYTRLIHENDVSDFQLIKRTESYYAHFRPLYMKVRNKNTDTISARKTDALISSLLKLKDAKQLNKDIIMNSMIEVKSYARQLEEISQQMDIFVNKSDVEKIMNFLNRDTTKILRDRIFPVAHLVEDSRERLEFLSAIFLDQMSKQGYIIRSGKLIEPSTSADTIW